MAVIYPALATVATFTAAAIILFLFGIEQVVTGLFLYKDSRFTHIGLGVLVLILSGLVIAYPLSAATLVAWLAALALLFSGIASIISGLRGKVRKSGQTAGKGSRALSIAAGAFAAALSIAVMVSPTFGVALAGFLIGIALLVYGIRLVVIGVAGRGKAVTSASSDTVAA